MLRFLPFFLPFFPLLSFSLIFTLEIIVETVVEKIKKWVFVLFLEVMMMTNTYDKFDQDKTNDKDGSRG